MPTRTGLAILLASMSFAGSAAHSQESKENSPTLPDSFVEKVQWRSVGPANMSGRIPAMAVYEKDRSIWWAASASGGLLKTVNNGASFEHQFDKEATVSIGDVQVAQSDPNIVWVGTGEANPRNSVSWGDGVYKSTDGGKTWTNMGLKKTFQTGRIAIHPTNPDIVYVGAMGRLWGPSEDRGLYKTTDGGKTWEKILYIDDKTGVIDVQMNQKSPDTLFVATYERKRDGFDGNDPEVKVGPGAGIYRTTDGGATFEKLSDGLPTVKMGRIGLSIWRKNPKFIYAVIETEKIGQAPPDMAFAGLSGEDADVGAKLTRITDDGPAAKAGLKAGDIIAAVDGQIVGSYDDFIKRVRMSKAGKSAKLTIVRDKKTQEIEITYAKVPEPTAGSRRSPRGSTGSPPFAQSLGGQNANLQDQQGENGFEYGGIYRSKNNGKTWQRINSLNPRPMYYSQIRVDPSDNNHIWILGTSLYKSSDGGTTFSGDGASGEVHVDHHSMWIDPTDGRHVILGNDGGLYVTWDRGKKWDHHNHFAIGQFYHVGVAPNRDYHVYGGLQDNGSWGGPTRVRNDSGSVNTDWYRVGSGDGFIVLVDPKDKDQIYFESQNGSMGRIHLKSGERGFIRPRAPRGTQYRFNWKTPFILSPHNSQIHYSAGNHVFRSVYKGDGIKAISPEITNTDKGAGSAIAESPLEEGVILAGTTDGALWVTTDGGKTWVDLFKNPGAVKAPASTTGGGRRGGRGPGGGRPGGGAGRGPRPGAPGAAGGSSQRPQRPSADPETAPKTESPEARPQPEGGQRQNFMARVIERLKENDANKDGKIQKDEVPERMRGLFERLDKNKDGVLDDAELKPPKPPQTILTAISQEGDKDKKSEATDQSSSEKQEADQKEGKAADEKDQQADEDEEKTEEPAAEEAADDTVSGTWSGRFISDRMPPDRLAFTLILRLGADNKVTGSMDGGIGGGGDLEGKFDPKTKSLTFVVETERSGLDFSGKISGKQLTGQIDINGGAFTLEYEATRTGDAPPADAAKAVAAGKPISELVPGPRWVSSLEASRFGKGRCYMTLDGHRSNDDEPYVFATEDYGKSWRSIRANLPTAAGSTRVIREDIANENVLYLGCEFSLWVSIDRGNSWTRLNNNLPTVAVHDIAQHPLTGEIVAGTHGRSLWIADVSALRQMSDKTLAADYHLYQPNTAVRWRSLPSRGSGSTRAFKAANPSSGATITYSLGKDANSVTVRISDIQGETVFETDGEKTSGLHTVDWNLSRQSSGQQSGRGGRGGRFRGRSVPTGSYLVTLTVDGNVVKQTLDVIADPTLGEPGTTDDEYELMKLLAGGEEEEGETSDEPRID